MGAFDVHIDLRDAITFVEAMQAVPEVYEREVTAATWQAGLLLQREIQELTPVGVGGGGGLKGSIAAQEPEVLADNVIGVVGTSLPHAVPVELGTKPHFPPLAPLEDWVRGKLGVSDNEVPGVAFRIARKIAIKGTEGAHMFERGFEDNETQVLRIYAGAAQRLRDHMGRPS